MSNIINLTHDDLIVAAEEFRNRWSSLFSGGNQRIYPIPRGGVPVAYLLQQYLVFDLVDDPKHATVFLDDIVDSGKTKARYAREYPDVPFLALFNRSEEQSWLSFPWEQADSTHEGVEDNITRLLQYIGEDPQRGGLIETPQRVMKAWEFWTSGYHIDPFSVVKTFTDGAESYDEMVLVKSIQVYSHCEHHMTPFFGEAHVAYIPKGKIVGLSKIARLVEVFARRLQTQERLTANIADVLESVLNPIGVGVLLRCRHLCMESRGIQQRGTYTITTKLKGAMLSPETHAREEFLKLALEGDAV